jgi:hypothetical protein
VTVNIVLEKTHFTPYIVRMRLLNTRLSAARLVLYAAVVMAFIPGPIFGYGTVGTSGATFLELGTSARALSMGEAYTAASEDVNLLYYNPSGLGTLQYPVASFVHQELLYDSRFENLIGAYPLYKGFLAVSASAFWVPPFDKIDINGAKTGSVNVVDTALTVGYGRDMGPLYLGGSIKYIYQKIDTLSVSSAAIDLGIMKQMYLYSPFAAPIRNFSLGMSVLNLGTTAKDDPLPRSLRMGASYIPIKWMKLNMDVSESVIDSDDLYDFTYGFEEGFRVNAGMELSWQDILYLRAGYRFNDAGTYTFGFGFNYAIENVSFIIDTSYSDNGQFGPNYALNVTFKLIPKIITAGDRRSADKHYQDGIRYYVADDLESSLDAFRKSRDYNPYQRSINEKIADLEELSTLKEKNRKYEEEEQKQNIAP